MVILYIYSTCWCIKSVFYERQQQPPSSHYSAATDAHGQLMILLHGNVMSAKAGADSLQILERIANG
jgi:hypothetical protein